jgi:hypothetical protein
VTGRRPIAPTSAGHLISPQQLDLTVMTANSRPCLLFSCKQQQIALPETSANLESKGDPYWITMYSNHGYASNYHVVRSSP